MAFKKTADGRVFFQNADDQDTKAPQPKTAKPVQTAQTMSARPKTVQTAPAANKTNDQTKTPQLRTAPVQSGGMNAQTQTQFQIIALLKTLNAKLQNTQAERDAMKKQLTRYESLITRLEDKANRTHDAYSDLSRAVKSKDNAVLEQARRSEQIAKEALSELDEARKLMMELEEKTDLSEKEMKRHMAQRKKIEADIAARQSEFNAFQKKLSDYALTNKSLTSRLNKTEEKQEAMSLQVSDAISKQELLDRKIEKTVQERSRMLRKVERIEEAVIQTRDAMNAKAMVLLTDQGENGNILPASLENMDDDTVKSFLKARAEAMASMPRHDDRPWWKRPLNVNPLSAASFIILTLLAGWMISEMQKPDLTNWQALQNPELSAPPFAGPGEEQHSFFGKIGQSSLEGIASMQDKAQDLVDNLMEPSDTLPEEETQEEVAQTPAAAPTETAQNPVQQGTLTGKLVTKPTKAKVNDDIGTLDINDTETLMKVLETDPDRVAAELNKIEPSSTPPQTYKINDAPSASALAIANVKIEDIPSAFSENEYAKADPNMPEAVKSIEEQALNGNANAQHDLAAIYTAGHGGVLQDYKRAAYWFEKAARAGVANAAYNLAVLNHQGLGVAENIPRAMQWYEVAASLGHPEALYNLGIAHIEGVGVSYDPNKAAAYFEKASDNGVIEAAYNLGLIYENGLLGEPSPDHAIVWYKRAADQGSPEAKAALEQLAKSLDISIAEINRLAESMKAAEDKVKQLN